MTLRRQLFLALSAVFLLILVGLLWMNVRGTRDYLEQQLGSHAQDAATSLSIPLSQSLGAGDRVLADLQVSTVFDRGFFQRIVVIDAFGQPVFTKELPAKVDDVPLWFSQWFELRPPGGEAFISAGWKQLGKVVVQSQPAYAYQYLWSNAREVALWVVGAYFVALLLTRLLLWVILNPLNAIERTAKAIQERRFLQIPGRPKARELARVVRAMNDMSRRISEILDAETAKAETFRKQVLHDEVTGRENRRSFDLRFGDMLEGQEPAPRGVVIGVELNGLKEFNTGASYQRGNILLKAVGDRCVQALGPLLRISARLGGASFGFVAVDTDPEQARAACQQLRQAVEQVFVGQEVGDALSFSVGGVFFSEGSRRGQVMARLDLAIEAAREAGRNALYVQQEHAGEQDSLGSLGWRDLILNALHENRWRLFGQPVVRVSDGSVLHSELMGRLLDQSGQPVQAAKFIPMATRHHLMAEVDKAIILLAKAHLRATGGEQALAVNVSAQSLEGKGFGDWLRSQLRELGPLARKLSFELSCYGCSQNLDAARAFAKLVREGGALFGMDRLGLEPLSVLVLRELPPDYVKLDSVLLYGVAATVPSAGASSAGVSPSSPPIGDPTSDPMNDQANAQQWVQSIMTLARSMDVVVIAQGVETEEQAAGLAGKYDAGQGYYFGAPAPLSTD
jgi:EAL domain-containing protein (putative c-di-GMP-specific phosphodiesterase class I)/GGDEF domain-containing protein